MGKKRKALTPKVGDLDSGYNMELMGSLFL